jgi:hypothetical protein
MMFVIEITDEDSPFKGWGRGWYADFEGDLKWKMHEIIRAIQGGKTTDVTVDWENDKAVETWLKKAKPIKFQTQLYNDKITIRTVRPLLEVAGVPATKAAATAVSKAAPEPVQEDEDGNVEDYTEEELTALTNDELVEILKEEFDVPEDDEDWPKKGRRDRTGSVYHKDLVDFVLDVQDDGEDGDEPEGEEGEPEFDDGFVEDATDEPEPDPEPEPPARTRRTRGAAKAAAPAAAPAKAAAPATRRRRS